MSEVEGLKKELGPEFTTILQKELIEDKQREQYKKMINDVTVMGVGYGGTQSLKGHGQLKKFIGRLTNRIKNIGIAEVEKQKATVWDGLRNNKKG